MIIKFLSEIYANKKNNNLVRAIWIYLSNVNMYFESSFVGGKAWEF